MSRQMISQASRLYPVKLLLEGPPKIGKTTVITRLVALLQEHAMPAVGFLTYELQEAGRRVGFVAQDLAGPEAVIAHVDIRTDVQVGRFGVDVAAFERVAIPALARADEQGGVVIIDELGRMELASSTFVTALHRVFAEVLPIIATVHVYEHEVTDALKQRTDVERLMLTADNRDGLPPFLFTRLMGSTAAAD